MGLVYEAVRPTETDRRQDLDITETGTPLAGAFEGLSLYSAATRSQRIIMTLAVAQTYVYRAFAAHPILSFVADGRGMGKSTHLEVTTAMSLNPLVVDYATQASVYNYLDEHPSTTVGLDEVDKIFGTTGRRASRDILRAVINASYSRKGKVLVTRGGKAVEIPVFCPMFTAGIGRLPDDTRDRALEIVLTRAMPEEIYLDVLHEDNLKLLGQRLREWLGTEEAATELASIDEASKHLAAVKGEPRFKLICAPLAAIAKYAGMHDQFLEAIREIQSGIAKTPPKTLAELLLADIQELWSERTEGMLGAAELVDMLKGHPSQRWDRLCAAGRLGEVTLASLLGESSIKTQASAGKRGYVRSAVMAAGAGGSDLHTVHTENTEHSGSAARFAAGAGEIVDTELVDS